MLKNLESFLSTFFQKSGRGQGAAAPGRDFKGCNPLTPQNSKQNLRKQILAIFF